MTTPCRKPLSRRGMLGLSAATAFVAAATVSSTRPRAGSAVPQTDARELAPRGRMLLADGQLLHSTVMQSFGFDERRGHLYALQLMQGGVRLDGERRAYTHTERARRGDLCLNRLSMDDNTLTGSMYLLGFGHGGALGVERTEHGGVLLWTEWNASPASGYGRGICRFPFADGTVLTPGSPRLTHYRPVPGSTSNTPTLDPVSGRLLLRYKIAGMPRFRLFDTARLAAHDMRPLADFAQPGAALGLPFQGMALWAGHVYQLLGSAYGPANPASSGGNIRLFRIHVAGGRVEQQILDATARDLLPREPEGLAVLTPRRADPLLCMGLTRGHVRDKSFSLYSRPLT